MTSEGVGVAIVGSGNTHEDVIKIHLKGRDSSRVEMRVAGDYDRIVHEVRTKRA